MIYFILTLTVAFFLLFSILFFTLKNGISPMPTSFKVRKHLLSVLPNLEKGQIVELGSGWGNLIFPLSQKYNACAIIGYENSPLPYFFSSLINHFSNLRILRQDFFERSLAEADLVICYLFPKGMEKLKLKLDKELKPGAKVVTHTFAVPGWTPTKTFQVDDLYRSKIYVYEVT